MTEKTRPVCSWCGSADISSDACARWSCEADAWEMVTTYDNTDCEDCSGECSLDWIPVSQPVVNEWERLARSRGWDMDARDVIVRNGAEQYGWGEACRADGLHSDDFLPDDEGETAEPLLTADS